MAEEDLELLLKYPLISCESEVLNRSKRYTGRILNGNHDVNLNICEQNNDGNFNFSCRLKSSYDNTINVNICSISLNVVEFVDRIVGNLKGKLQATPKNLTRVYKRILQEYYEFNEFHLITRCQISPDLTKISVTTTDQGGQDHILEILADFTQTKNIFAPIDINLPEAVVKDFPTNFSNLTEIYTKFTRALETLESFFDIMDRLDKCCCILDPEQPFKRACYRRIWLDQNLSVIIIINPLNPKTRPELRYLGPKRVVDQYLQKLNDKLEDWDDKNDFLQELLNILEMETFPSKPTNEKNVLMDIGECCICFSLRLNDNSPKVICDNKSCENFYHVECLYEWLTSVNSKRIFNELIGQCPNCEKKIACPLPEAEV